uniref:Uncharacterized protein n=1 Tax=Anguilla anguilla TaxID=7936 RepID=A0A0E9T8H0_ANGAN
MMQAPLNMAASDSISTESLCPLQRHRVSGLHFWAEWLEVAGEACPG